MPSKIILSTNLFLVLVIVTGLNRFQSVKNVDNVSYENPEILVNHSDWHNLLQKHVSAEGIVNYKGFELDKVSFDKYVSYLQETTPQDSWSKEEQLAFWINAYNAFTIDLILKNLPLQSIRDIKKPWNQKLWEIDEKWYSLNEIEHDILRKLDEPRIHFAIVCASVSCPKLQNSAFVASDLENQLDIATKEFISDASKNEISEDHIKLSKIFKWFAKDFKSNGTLIDFLNQYSEVNISNSAKKKLFKL